jgi:cell division protein FtsB
VLVLGAILLSYVGPTTKYFRTWRLAHQTRADVQSLRAENERLRARAARLRDPEQIELEARKIGMARPGERVYVVRGLPRK